MRYLCSRLLLLLILMSVGATTEAATEIAATYRLPDPIETTFAVPFGNNGGAAIPVFRIAQTFTAEVSGRLLTASVTAASLDVEPTGLQLAVTALENGQPGSILATSPLQGLHVNGQFSDIDVLNAIAHFSGDQVVLQSQQQYALLLVAERLNSNFQILGDQTSGTGRSYPGGEILRSRSGTPFVIIPNGELAFEVTVETIPEPMTLTLSVIGTAASWGRGRRCRH